VLGDLVPARRAELLERADAIAEDRVVIGVHYPTDIAAGKALADLFHASLLQSEAYRRDLQRTKALVVK
jgi:acid phosphatase (class A)